MTIGKKGFALWYACLADSCGTLWFSTTKLLQHVAWAVNSSGLCSSSVGRQQPLPSLPSPSQFSSRLLPDTFLLEQLSSASCAWFLAHSRKQLSDKFYSTNPQKLFCHVVSFICPLQQCLDLSPEVLVLGWSKCNGASATPTVICSLYLIDNPSLFQCSVILKSLYKTSLNKLVWFLFLIGPGLK
jgi:hypothetical protein